MIGIWCKFRQDSINISTIHCRDCKFIFILRNNDQYVLQKPPDWLNTLNLSPLGVKGWGVKGAGLMTGLHFSKGKSESNPNRWSLSIYKWLGKMVRNPLSTFLRYHAYTNRMPLVHGDLNLLPPKSNQFISESWDLKKSLNRGFGWMWWSEAALTTQKCRRRPSEIYL